MIRNNWCLYSYYNWCLFDKLNYINKNKAIWSRNNVSYPLIRDSSLILLDPSFPASTSFLQLRRDRRSNWYPSSSPVQDRNTRRQRPSALLVICPAHWHIAHLLCHIHLFSNGCFNFRFFNVGKYKALPRMWDRNTHSHPYTDDTMVKDFHLKTQFFGHHNISHNLSNHLPHSQFMASTFLQLNLT